MRDAILVVDDDASIRETFEIHLSESGYDVTAVPTAEQALAVLSRHPPAIAIVDLRLPGLDGLELVTRLRARAPRTAVLVITAHQEMESAVEAIRRGAYDYLVKPLDLDQIDLLLRRCLGDLEQSRGSETPRVAKRSMRSQVVGRDPKMVEVFKMIGQVSRARATVLIRGETGTGKEAIARAIHDHSSAASHPFVAVNCAALTETLLESELFGHVKGAFTGAGSDRKGRFELAGEGTVFLDEIGDTTQAFQAKLLRVLEEQLFYPVGAERPRATRARVIAATHRPIERMIESREFRDDLYFRLKVVEIRVPPLRERRGDIPLLVEHLLTRIAERIDKRVTLVSDEAMALLVGHHWPGNVRELEHCLLRAAVRAPGPVISADVLDVGPSSAVVPNNASREATPRTLDDVESAHVQRVLVETGGVKAEAARQLGISRGRLDRLIEKHHLVVPDRGSTSSDS